MIGISASITNTVEALEVGWSCQFFLTPIAPATDKSRRSKYLNQDKGTCQKIFFFSAEGVPPTPPPP